MQIERLCEDKERYKELLFMADSDEARVDADLQDGDLFLLRDESVICTACVVVRQAKRRCVLKDLVTIPKMRGKGYGTYMVQFVSECYSPDCDFLYVDLGNRKRDLEFFRHCGFETIHLDQDLKRICMRKPLSDTLDPERVVDLAAETGRVLLKNGGEIFRVDETIAYICHRFHLDQVDSFTVSHGIFVTAGRGRTRYTRVKSVPVSTTDLTVVSDVNQLSREISEGRLTVSEAERRLAEIDQAPPEKAWKRMAAAGVASASFGFLLGAGFCSSVVAGVVGAITYACILAGRWGNLPKMLLHIFGGALITALAVLAQVSGLFGVLRIEGIISGAIMPLIPGMTFVNAIRDLAGGDFLSGTVRMVDAILVFVYIAIGVGLTLGACSYLLGGLFL